MTDDLTERIAEVLGAHLWGYLTDDKGWEWTACRGCDWGEGDQIHRSDREAFYAHQAEQVRAVLGETTTEWGVRWFPQDKHATPWPDEHAARYHAGPPLGQRAVVTRTVTPWIEVPE